MDDFSFGSDSDNDSDKDFKRSKSSRKRPHTGVFSKCAEKRQKSKAAAVRNLRSKAGEKSTDWESSDEEMRKLPKRFTKGVGKKSRNVAFKSHDSEIPRRDNSSFGSVSDVFSE